MEATESMRAIIEAFAALHGALGVSCNVSSDRGGLSFQAHDDAGVHALASALGLEVRVVDYARERTRWLAADGCVSAIRVSVFGPHHGIGKPLLDERSAAEAVEQARAAIAGASS